MAQPVRTYLFLHHAVSTDYSHNELEVGTAYDDGTSIVRKLSLDPFVIEPGLDLKQLARDILVGLAEQL